MIFENETHEYSCNCEAAPADQLLVILDSSFEGILPTRQLAEL